MFILLGLVTLAAGLLSRRDAALLPPWAAKNAGDVLYAVFIYWLAGALTPRLSPLQTAAAALTFCIGIEFLKLVQTPWLVAVRHNAFGALVFGRGFHVSNLVCYVLGVGAALLIETVLLSRRSY